MADARTSGDDDALPSSQQQHHREPSSSLIADESKLPHLEPVASGADRSSDGMPSSEGHNRGLSEQGPSSTPGPGGSATLEPVKSTVDPMIAKHVSDVLSSEVETIPVLSCAAVWLNMMALVLN